MKALLKGLGRFLLRIQIPLYLLNRAENFFALAQGKGWGTNTVKIEVDLCLKLLDKSPSILVDIGANKGIYTQEVLKQLPATQCHLFEPSRYNIDILNQLFYRNKSIKISPCALSDKSDTLDLYSDYAGSGLASLSSRKLDHFGIHMDPIEKVNVMRFDQYWSSLECPSDVIDYVKIDVEGYELFVLRGFGSLIEKVRLIQFEFGGCNIDTRTYFRDFWYFFLKANFSLLRITPRGLMPIQAYSEANEFFSTTNYIALNNKFKPPLS